MKAARALRQEQTEAEIYLWDLLRNRNFEGIKFRRQHPIKDYIVDFFSYELKLVIELDGGYHYHPEQKEKDELRDLHLKALGYQVLRYSNDTALTQTHIIYNDISERKATYKPIAKSTRSRLPSPSGEVLVMSGKTLLSTKRLQPNQRELLLNAGMGFVEYNAIEIKSVDFTLPRKLENVIITSQNGAQIVINKTKELPSPEGLVSDERGTSERKTQGVRYFVVGEKTTALLTKNGLKVTTTAQNASELAHFIAKNHKNEQFTYFCGAQRRDDLPDILKEAGIVCNEVVVYETYLNEQSFTQAFDGILFFSPSGVKSFVNSHPSTSLRVQENSWNSLSNRDNPSPERSLRAATIFCIGETTATEARKHFETVIVSNDTTIESTIAKAVKTLTTK